MRVRFDIATARTFMTNPITIMRPEKNRTKHVVTAKSDTNNDIFSHKSRWDLNFRLLSDFLRLRILNLSLCFSFRLLCLLVMFVRLLRMFIMSNVPRSVLASHNGSIDPNEASRINTMKHPGEKLRGLDSRHLNLHLLLLPSLILHLYSNTLIPLPPITPRRELAREAFHAAYEAWVG